MRLEKLNKLTKVQKELRKFGEVELYQTTEESFMVAVQDAEKRITVTINKGVIAVIVDYKNKNCYKWAKTTTQKDAIFYINNIELMEVQNVEVAETSEKNNEDTREKYIPVAVQMIEEHNTDLFTIEEKECEDIVNGDFGTYREKKIIEGCVAHDLIAEFKCIFLKHGKEDAFKHLKKLLSHIPKKEKSIHMVEVTK